MFSRLAFSTHRHSRAFKTLAISAFVMLLGSLAASGGGNSPNSSVWGRGAALFAPQPAVAQTTAWALNRPFRVSNDLDASQTARIYVPNTNNTVTIYTTNGALVKTISAGLNNPDAVTVDTAGKIYVANIGNETITTYKSDGTPTTPTIRGIDPHPADMEFGAAGQIYVTNFDRNTVSTYTANGTRTTPTITQGLSGPNGLAIDAAGKIYVANYNNNTVTTYTAKGTRTTPTITVGLNRPAGIAVDAAGKIYVANNGNNTVTTYTANGTPTTPTITNALNLPAGIGVDATGKIYVTNFGNNTLTTYTSKGVRTTPTITQGLSGPRTLEIATPPERLYVANNTGNPFVAVFGPGASGNAAPERTLNIPGTGCSGGGGLTGIALDSLRNLYVGDDTECSDHATWVRVYAPGASGNAGFIREIGGNFSGNPGQVYFPKGLVIDSSDNLYVGNGTGPSGLSSVTVYAKGASAPKRTISGSKTGFGTNDLYGLTVDVSGDLAVTVMNFNSCDPQTVREFAPGMSGNVAPTRTLAKGLCSNPFGDAFDSSGNLYVASQQFEPNQAIFIYAPGTSSVGPPTRKITGSLTKLNNPFGVAFDSKGNLFVSNQGTNSITVYAPGATGNVAPIRTISGSNTKLNGPSYLAIGP